MPHGRPERTDQPPRGTAIDQRQGYAGLRRRLRRDDPRWYFGCRLRSFTASLLDSMKYLDFGWMGAHTYAEMRQHHSFDPSEIAI